MPQLVRLYIRNVLLGAVLSALFVAMLLTFNVGNLRHLIFTSDIGVVALVMLFAFNTIVFSAVQFGISVMRMADDETPPAGGKRDAIPHDLMQNMALVPIPVPVRSHRLPGKKLR